ncbi:MAG: right-handed parallel beta-helix repeat-containing protein [Methylophilaceae bacterium]|nr:right-handed parallel beta-helix repeat-containing protein [Methylophilaceae bacterium]
MFTPLKNKKRKTYYMQPFLQPIKALIQTVSKLTQRTSVLFLLSCIITLRAFATQPTTHTAAPEVAVLVAGIAALHLAPDAALADLPTADEQSTSIRAPSCSGTSTLITPPYTISSPGNYHLGSNGTGDITITAAGVCFSLNNYILTGRVIISGARASVRNGTIRPTAAANNTAAAQAAVEITSDATETELLDVTITCLARSDMTSDDPSSNLINGRLAVSNAADSVTISGCTITAANGQGYSRSVSGNALITFRRTTGSGGTGIYNSGTNMLLQNSTITAGSGGKISATIALPSVIHIGYISIANGFSNLATTGTGGIGISNSGTTIQIKNNTITAGSSGYIYTRASGIGIDGDISIGFNAGRVTIDTGGAGVSNSGTGAQITDNTITAGASGYIDSLNSITTTDAPTSIGGNNGRITLNAGGSGIDNSGDNTQITNNIITAAGSGYIKGEATHSNVYIGDTTSPVTIGTGGAGITNSGSNSLITGCTITAANGGTPSVTAPTKYGSANGGAGGHAIACTGTANNICIANTTIIKSGTGGNGYRETNPNDNPGYRGDGGNGGNALSIAPTCSNIQLRDVLVQQVGAGGATGGASPAIPGNPGQVVTTPTNYQSIIFSLANPAAQTAPRVIHYYKKV